MNYHKIAAAYADGFSAGSALVSRVFSHKTRRQVTVQTARRWAKENARCRDLTGHEARAYVFAFVRLYSAAIRNNRIRDPRPVGPKPMAPVPALSFTVDIRQRTAA